MDTQPSAVAHSAQELIRTGRFSAAVNTLLSFDSENTGARKSNAPVQALLADALQRVGQNQRAQEIASRNIPLVSQSSILCARFHFTLGNVYRERGDNVEAIRHLQMAAAQAGTDPELACWSQLRIIAAIADLNGIQAALGRLDHVRRTLTQFGDPRPFAALHLWLAEAESTRGQPENARRHLRIAAGLLSQINDIWLQGYLAINSSVVHYYSAEIPEARRWAEIAIQYSDESGHRTTRRAALSNLGYIELSMGEFARAQEHFEVALSCCEGGSANEILILDNIAEAKLHGGDLIGCKSILLKIAELTSQSHQAKRRHSDAWAIHTHIRLLLIEGHRRKARELSEALLLLVEEMPNSRLKAESYLLAAETLLADGDAPSAAACLAPIFSSEVQLPPDLFAESERIYGSTLAASGAQSLARVHLERAARTFDAVGHLVGKQRSIDSLALTNDSPFVAEFACHRFLDRIRSLMHLRMRPELFGHEAVSLLEDLQCAEGIQLVVSNGQERSVIRYVEGKQRSLTNKIAISSGASQTLSLVYEPRTDVRSKLAALSFDRMISLILGTQPSCPALADQTIVWAQNEGPLVNHGAIFASDAMLQVLRTIKQIAPTDVSILVTGETGTGKEIVAKTIHEYSRRSQMAFTAFNCSAVPRDLLESQLFGHKKGAFSGASDGFLGIVRAANGGTLLLDEIGEIPYEMQAKLLRFLEESEVHPIGESRPVKVDVRLIFATNGDLDEAVKQNRFRQDLFYRMNIVPIKVPPLRERRQEIPVLANLFAQQFGREFSKEPIRFSASAMELLILYAWPGNVRQLKNEVRRLAAVVESGSSVSPDQLSSFLQTLVSRSEREVLFTSAQTAVRIDQPLDEATATLETEMIKRALRLSGGNMGTAASVLGISRKGLYLKRLRLGLMDPH